MQHSSLPTLAAATLAIAFIGCTVQAPTPPADTTMSSSSSSLATMGMSSSAMAAVMPLATPDAKIANAMSAAPADIAKDATVLDWPVKEGGEMPVLRKGANSWTCLPDQPSTPGNDPICADANGVTWFQAYMQKKTPKLTQAGIAYMLQGGSDASNTDPFAVKPAEGEDWMNAPAHIMIFPAGDLDPKAYGTDMNGGPWIMWSGTPYEHLMVPVK